MHISFEGKVGIFLALIFGLGAGAIMVWPDDKWIGWAIMAVSAIGLGALAIYHFQDAWRKGAPRGTRRMLALVGMGIFGLAFLGCASWYFWPTKEPLVADAKSALKAPWKHTLENLYASDFGLLSLERKVDVTVADPKRGLPPTTVQIRFRLYQDFLSNSDFVAIFVPVTHDIRVDDKLYTLIKSFETT